ncbi:hypothetical protein [Aquimarina algicola]|uniref:Uncharacterized protein n=1 Tax=Aquimarina algicola TaxID=2589995 RepID=A0A504JE78_9FLAO|nr:hypothetical protein [Aquimarina algicola]TPN84691.1 hypothetical protein FHK87_17340 [Aquimarina algicola]
MIKNIYILFIFIFISQFYEECYSQTTISTIVDIEKVIELKANDKEQQEMLINFKNKYKADKRISVEEFQNHYELIVSHEGKSGYTGGAEGYTMDKKTGKIEMIWHESPMKLPEKKIRKIHL